MSKERELRGTAAAYPKIAKPTFLERLKLRTIYGRVRFGCDPEEPWLFLAHCPSHRLYMVDYQHGWDGRLTCPKCEVELFKLRKQNLGLAQPPIRRKLTPASIR